MNIFRGLNRQPSPAQPLKVLSFAEQKDALLEKQTRFRKLAIQQENSGFEDSRADVSGAAEAGLAIQKIEFFESLGVTAEQCAQNPELREAIEKAWVNTRNLYAWEQNLRNPEYAKRMVKVYQDLLDADKQAIKDLLDQK